MPKVKPKEAGIIIKLIIIPSLVLPAPLLPGSSLATLAVALPVGKKQLAVPQLYPDGQHPAVGPASVGHMVQPPAQVPSEVVVGTAVRGTTIVWSPDMMVVDTVDGHDVTWQSRPVWQQPPP